MALTKDLLKLLKERPLSTKEIRKRTGWTHGQLWGFINRAKKQGLITSDKPGVYRLVDEFDLPY